MEYFRRQVWFEGRVQGVGFRYKAAQLAKGYDVCGFVKNLEDGRVHLAAAGEEREVEAFVEALEKSMADFIRKKQVKDDRTDRRYKGFKIEI